MATGIAGADLQEGSTPRSGQDTPARRPIGPASVVLRGQQRPRKHPCLWVPWSPAQACWLGGGQRKWGSLGKPAGESRFRQEEGMLADQASLRGRHEVWAPGGIWCLLSRVATGDVPCACQQLWEPSGHLVLKAGRARPALIAVARSFEEIGRGERSPPWGPAPVLPVPGRAVQLRLPAVLPPCEPLASLCPCAHAPSLSLPARSPS